MSFSKKSVQNLTFLQHAPRLLLQQIKTKVPDTDLLASTHKEMDFHSDSYAWEVMGTRVQAGVTAALAAGNWISSAETTTDD